MPSFRTIEWKPLHAAAPLPGRIRILDQTRLPGEQIYLELEAVDEVWRAIQTLQVRGAPAIGIAAAMGVVVAIQHSSAATSQELIGAINQAADYLASSRPTAVNLFWALDRMRALAGREAARPPAELKQLLWQEAQQIWTEDVAMCRAIGIHGATLLEDGQTVLTHCNAGRLCAAQYGTALAPIYMAQEQGKRIRVYADETRPLLQGARLTAWELMHSGIEVVLICDNTAAQVMKEGRVDLIMVGADRIAANGDVANKIGTYGLAILARAHRIPFYVLAPTSTFDLTLPTGAAIPIEERAAAEITCAFGQPTAPQAVRVYAPAFDVTPADLIQAIICERGILRPPFAPALRHALGGLA